MPGTSLTYGVRSFLIKLCDLLLLISLLLLAPIWIFDPLKIFFGPMHLTMHWNWKPWVFLVVFITLSAGLRWIWKHKQPPSSGLWSRRWFSRTMLAVASLYLFFGVLEGSLYLVGFESHIPPVVYEGADTSEDQGSSGALPDPDLLWKFRPGIKFHGVPINSLGFREREVDPKKPEGAARIICMGDSCTAQGKPGYAGYLHEMLSKNPPTPRTWEAFNLAVYGYSSLQGLRLYQKLGHTLDPDIVTLYYGWNDHWLHEQTDRQRMAWHVDAWAGRMIETLREKRFFMLMMWAMKSQRARKLDSITSEYRVPPEEYREVLTRFIQDIRNSDAVPLLITAPRRSLQPSVVNSGHAHSLTEAETVHDRYVRITREVADTCNVELLDLAVIFDTPEADAYFKPDGIHFTQEGLKQIATELYHSITPLSIRMARTQPDNIQHKP